MKIIETKYKDSKFLTLKNYKNLEITFSTRGASIYSIKYKDDFITYQVEDKDEFLVSKKYYGKTLGRVCGRIKNGIIKVNNKEYKLDKNEKGVTTLHGGFNNISYKEFDYVINENDELFNIIFKYKSNNLECGFPGNANFIVVYSVLKNKNKFLIHYHALTDEITPINMSTHIYWRLKGNDVLNHELYVDADNIIKIDKDQTNIGKTSINNIFDFRIPKKISKDIYELAKIDKISNGYDHGWLLNKKDFDEPSIILSNDNLSLKVRTDMNNVNIYTNCYPDGKEIKQYGKDIIYGGIAIEPQMYFTNVDDILIDKDNPFDHYISFELEEK